jgi:hypothetical protein
VGAKTPGVPQHTDSGLPFPLGGRERAGGHRAKPAWKPGSASKNLPIMSTESLEIDNGLYSRQSYVLGDTAMQKMAKSHVFLSGMGGLGLEIGKQCFYPFLCDTFELCNLNNSFSLYFK